MKWQHCTQKMRFSIKDFFSKCDQIRRKPQIWSHLLKKSLMKNFIFMQCKTNKIHQNQHAGSISFYRGFFKNKKGPGTTFQATINAEFFDKNFSFAILHKLAKFLF